MLGVPPANPSRTTVWETLLYSVAAHTVQYSTIYCTVLQYIIVQYTVLYSIATVYTYCNTVRIFFI